MKIAPNSDAPSMAAAIDPIAKLRLQKIFRLMSGCWLRNSMKRNSRNIVSDSTLIQAMNGESNQPSF